MPLCPICGQPVTQIRRYQRILNKRGLDLLDAKSAKAVEVDMQKADLALEQPDANLEGLSLEILLPTYRLYEKVIQNIGLSPSLQVIICPSQRLRLAAL